MAESEDEAFLCIPRDVLTSMLAAEDLAELKAVLTVLQLSGSRATRAVAATELQAPGVQRAIAGPANPEGAQKRAQRAVDRAVSNGSLLRVSVGSGTDQMQYLLAATHAGRARIDRVRGGDQDAATELDFPPDAAITVYRPNVFAFYEQHLGPLTPLVADQLRDAERSYPRVWLEEAIMTAADAQTRSWRYIETVLTRWEVNGPPPRHAGSSQPDQ